MGVHPYVLPRDGYTLDRGPFFAPWLGREEGSAARNRGKVSCVCNFTLREGMRTGCYSLPILALSIS